MKIILLEKIHNLGSLGEEVIVKPGFARNYLFPNYKAVLANKRNRSFFQNKIKEIEKKNNLDMKELELKKEAINNMQLEMSVKSSEKGKLFGSVTNKHISKLFEENDIKVEKNEIKIDGVINKTGDYEIFINLKNNIKVKKTLSVKKED